MGGEVSVGEAECLQMVAQQLEVVGLLLRDAGPLPVEGLGHGRKAPAQVESEIDGVQLDVGERVDQCGAAFGGGHRALFDLRMRNEKRALGAAGNAGRLGECVARPGRETGVERASAARLAVRVGIQEDRQGAGAKHYRASIGTARGFRSRNQRRTIASE